MRTIGARAAYYLGGPEGMARLGFRALNYADFASLASPLYALDDAEARARMEAALSEIRAAGLCVNQTHGPCPTDDTTEESRARNFALTLRAIDLTAWLQARDLVIHPILPFGQASRREDEVFDANVRWLRALLPHAGARGVRLNVENLPYAACEISHMRTLAAVTAAVDDPACGLCLDTGHAACLGDDPAEMARLAGKRLYTLHVHDNDLRHDLHLIPFAGRIDWAAFRDALDEIGFDGVVSLEVNLRGRVPAEMQPAVGRWLADAANYINGTAESFTNGAATGDAAGCNTRPGISV